MQIIRHKLGRLDLHLCDLGQILLVVDTVAQHIAKLAQRALQGICRGLLLGLLKRSRFALTVLNVAVSEILMERSVTQGDSHDNRDAHVDFQCLRVLINEVDLDVLDAGGPAVEAEDLVRELDALFRRDVVDFLA